MEWENVFQEEDDELRAEEEEKEDAIIFLIDSQRPMFEKNEQQEVPFFNAIKCAIATLTDKIISSDSDLVGICFYGTRQKKNPNEFDGVYVFMDLDVPDAQKIMDLESILNREEEFSTNYGSSQKEFSFGDALWACSTMFSLCNVKVGHKRIFLFTNEDNPNAGNQQLRERSLQRSKDLNELGIDIELFSMNKPGKVFDPMLFYQYIIVFSEDEAAGAVNFDASSKFEELRARVRRKEFKKRSHAKLSIIIGKDIEIAVRMYKLLQSAKKGSYLWLDSKTNQPIKSISKWVCADTGTLLMDSQIKYSYLYGGERIVFDKEEITAIKNFDVQGLRLMGFKPVEAIKGYNIRTADFIYPDEFSIKGSTVAFSALLDRMIAMKKIAICKITPRSEASPRFAALLPQEEILDSDGTQNTPPGFHVIYLPYADDIRNLKLDPTPKATTDQVVKAKKLVKTLRIKFDSRNFENPALQKHYANLQAIALERETVENVPDYVLPDEEGMEKYAEIIEDYKQSVFPPDYVPNSSKTKKRKAEDGENTKKEKPAPTKDELASAVKNDGLKKFTVPQLKEWLKSQGVKVPSKWKKDEVVQKVKEMVGPSTATTTTETRSSDPIQDDDEEEQLVQPSKKQKSRVIEDDEEDIQSTPHRSQVSVISKPSKPSKSVSKQEDEEDMDVTPTPQKSQVLSKPASQMSSSPSQHEKPSQPVSRSQDFTGTRTKPCPFGPKCYRKNPQHFQEFSHPWLEQRDWNAGPSQSQSGSQPL